MTILKNTICLGIAGNFAHHLEQAGEASDFVDVVTEEAHTLDLDRRITLTQQVVAHDKA